MSLFRYLLCIPVFCHFLLPLCKVCKCWFSIKYFSGIQSLLFLIVSTKHGKLRCSHAIGDPVNPSNQTQRRGTDIDTEYFGEISRRENREASKASIEIIWTITSPRKLRTSEVASTQSGLIWEVRKLPNSTRKADLLGGPQDRSHI